MQSAICAAARRIVPLIMAWLFSDLSREEGLSIRMHSNLCSLCICLAEIHCLQIPGMSGTGDEIDRPRVCLLMTAVGAVAR